MSSDYAFASRWSVAVSRDALWDEIEDLLASTDPMVWWPSVSVKSYDGEAMRLRAASGLGYALTFTLVDLDVRRPGSMSFTSAGDLRGSGTVLFVDQGPHRCAMEIDWQVTPDRRWMRWSGWLLRPLFAAGHHLVMRRGERQLNTWLGSRAA